MKSSPFQINHPVYADIPEEVLLTLLMIWDLSEDQSKLRIELLKVLDGMIDRIPLFEIPSRKEVVAVYDLTDNVVASRKRGKGLKIRLDSNRSLKRGS